jgi:hypothetical protein
MSKIILQSEEHLDSYLDVTVADKDYNLSSHISKLREKLFEIVLMKGGETAKIIQKNELIGNYVMVEHGKISSSTFDETSMVSKVSEDVTKGICDCFVLILRK